MLLQKIQLIPGDFGEHFEGLRKTLHGQGSLGAIQSQFGGFQGQIWGVPGRLWGIPGADLVHFEEVWGVAGWLWGVLRRFGPFWGGFG